MNINRSAELGSRIIKLRKRLKLTQSQLAHRLNTSAMAVSRWERGTNAAPAAVCVLLGSLAGKDECWYFWGKAGLSSDDVVRVLSRGRKHLPSSSLPVLQVVAAEADAKIKKNVSLMAIPLLPLFAAADTEGGSSHFDFDLVEPEGMLAAPVVWCPNPTLTTSLRVKGNSMEPLLHDGYIIVVDRRQKDRSKLKDKVIVAFCQKYGLVVSRLRRVDKVEMLVPHNRKHDPVSFTHDWRIVGKVLWWVGMPDLPK
jgi:DNA-binding XRE family transcriptional regulator